MKIVALDPGGTTGVVVARGDHIITAYQLGPDPHHEELYALLNTEVPDVIVCEGFDYRPGISRAVLTPVEYIGICKLWVAQTHLEHELIVQSPSQPKTFWSDHKLKSLNLWLPGQQHARDAIRHYLHYITFKAGMDSYLKRLN